MSQHDAHNGEETGTPLFDSGPGVLAPADSATRGQAPSVDAPTLADQQAAARRKIQDMALDFVRAMATFNPSQPPQIPLAPRPVTFRVGDLESEHDDSPFPSIRSLAQTVKVMRIVHDHLAAPTQRPLDGHGASVQVQGSSQSNLATNAAQRPHFVTRRDVYYQDPELFKSQRTVDAVVHSLALTIHPLAHSHGPTTGNAPQPSTLLDASHLGVVASSRGVALGSCKIHLLPPTTNSSSESNIVDLGPAGSTGALLPPGAQIQRVELDQDVAWVLIVEKDATFQTLAQLDFPRSCTPPGLIVTARGFPDVATRQFLRLLPEAIQMYTLVDADPFGVHIHWMYQQAMMGRAVTHLGVRLEDLIHEVGGQEKVMPLEVADLKRIKFLMENEDVKQQAGIMRTLQIMLHTRVKAEIQALSGQLLPYLHQRLQTQPIQSQRMSITFSAV